MDEITIYEAITRLRDIGRDIGMNQPLRLSSGEAFAIVTDRGSSVPKHRQSPIAHALITTNLKDHRV